MPRHARLHAPGTIHHIIARFVNKEWRINNEVARDAYRARIATAFAHTDAIVLADGLMSSHVHLVVELGVRPPWEFMHSLQTAFAHWINQTQGRLGPVWADRYSCLVVDRDQTLRLIVYVHNNPVRAGIVHHAVDSTWTSHRCYTSDEESPAWLDEKRGLKLCGFGTSRAGRREFDAFVRAHEGDPRDPKLSASTTRDDRAKIREELGGPVETTSPSMTKEGEHAFGILAPSGMLLRPRWSGDPRRVIALVSQYMGAPVERIASALRQRDIVTARRLALLTWVGYLGRDQKTMAALVGISGSAASHLLADHAGCAGLAEKAEFVAQQCWRESDS
jgi:REP element-mobilizing transposase RayT